MDVRLSAELRASAAAVRPVDAAAAFGDATRFAPTERRTDAPMKYALVIPDGAADEPQKRLQNRTPLQAARTPHMDAVAAAGLVGRTDNVPSHMPSGSDVGTMSLFGTDPAAEHTGRAPLEAAAQGIELGEHDWAVRCNLVQVAVGKMKSFTAEQVPTETAHAVIAALQASLPDGSPWRFAAGVSYRNLLIYRGQAGQEPPFGPETKTEPPHDITGRPIGPFLPQGPGAGELQRLMDASRELLAAGGFSRPDGRPMPTQAWLWGQGSRPRLRNFQERFGVRGAVITAVDLLRGIGRLLGWDVIEVEGATGYTDTDYAAKGRAAIAALEDHDFVVVHVEATDEASHEGDARAKVAALERIDADIVGPLHEHLQSQGEYRLLVCPDHPTFLRTKTHAHGYVPFACCGTGVSADASATYDELAAAQAGRTIDRGHELMGRLFAASMS